MLEFNAITHTYSKNGVTLPSVTQVIDSVCPEAFHHVNHETMEKAQQRGTAVHSITEFFDKGVLDEETIDDELQGYFEAYKQFVSDMKPEFQMIEKMVDSDLYGFAGTLDRIGTMQGFEFLLDIKSGCKSRWTGVQTAAYLKAVEDDTFRKRFGLYLQSNGKYCLIEYSDANDFNVFLSALNVYKFKKAI